MPRLQDPLYLFNCFGMLLPYTVVVILNFVWYVAPLPASGIVGAKLTAIQEDFVQEQRWNVHHRHGEEGHDAPHHLRCCRECT